MYNTKGELVSQIMKNIPYPNQVKDIDLDSISTAIFFTWRGSKYRYSLGGSIEEHKDGLLVGSDICIVMRELLNRDRTF